MFKPKVTAAVLVGAFFCIAGRAHAQTFKPGDSVYGSSTYSPGGWTSGCRIVSGPEVNNACSVTCGSDSFRTQPPWIRAAAEGPPAPVADPMRPGQIIAMPGLTSAAPAAARRCATPSRTSSSTRLRAIPTRGHAGWYRYTPSTGELTFGSGPYAGSYSKMVDATTISLSAKGTTSLGTQCGLKQ